MHPVYFLRIEKREELITNPTCPHTHTHTKSHLLSSSLEILTHILASEILPPLAPMPLCAPDLDASQYSYVFVILSGFVS